MLKASLITLGVLFVLAIAAILIGPSFIDWNRYKPQIAARAERMTGRDLDIAGDISVRVLPMPTLSAEGVRFANIEAGSAPEMATLDALRVRVAFWPLLQGDIQVEEVVLVNPTILLETTADGRNNWELGGPDSGEEGAHGSGDGIAGGLDISLDNVSVADGTVVYRDLGAGTEQRVEDLDADIAAETLRGPFRATGEAVVDGEPVTFDVTTGRLDSTGPESGQTAALRLNLGLAQADAALQFAGSLLLQGAESRLRGRLEGDAADLGALLALLPGAAGASPVVAGQTLDLAGTLDATTTLVALNDLSLQLGDTTGSGTVTIVPGTPAKADIALTVNRLALDPLVDGEGTDAVDSGGNRPQSDGAPEDGGSPGGGGFALPDGIVADLALTIVAITYRDGLVNDLRLAASLSDGALELTRLTALLPGGSDITAVGTLAAAEGVPRFTGSLDASSDNFRSLLEWLALGLPEVPSDRLRRMSFAGQVTATPATVEIADIDLRLDSSRVRGGVVVALPTGPRRRTPGFGIGLAVNEINLDAYLPAATSTGERPGKEGTGEEPAEQAGAGLPLEALAPLAGLAANLDLRIGSLTYDRQTLKGIHLDGTVQQGSLTLRELSVAQFAGGQGSLSGTVTDLAGAPRFDTEFNLTAKDAARALQLAGLDDPAPDGLGTLAVGGTLAGGAESITYDIAFTIDGIDARGQAEGTASGFGGGLPRLDTEFVITADDSAPLLLLAGLSGEGGGGLGALSVSGSAKTEADALTYNVALTAAGIEGGGELAGTISDLATTPQIDSRVALTAAQPAPLLRLAGLEGGAAARLGALGLEGELTGGVEDLRLDLALTGLGGEGTVTGTLAAAATPVTFDLAVEATHPEPGALLAALAEDGVAPAASPGAFRLDGTAQGSSAAFAVRDLIMEAGPTRLTGTVDVEIDGVRPRVSAELQGNEMVLGWLTGGPAEGNGEPEAGPANENADNRSAEGRWSTEPLDLSALDLANADIDLTAEAFILGETRIEQPELALTLQNGVLEVRRFTGEVYGGAIDLTGRLASRNGPAATASVTATGVALERLMQGGTVAEHIRGPISVSADLRSAGANLAELIGGLQGGGTLDGTVKVLAPVEQQVGSALLGLLGAEVAQLRGVTDRIGALYSAFTGGPNALSGSFRVENGVLRTDDTTLTGDTAHATAAGTADLPDWLLDMQAQLYRGETSDAPFLTVTLQGPLDEPDVGLSGAALSSGAARAGDLLNEVVPGLSGESGVPEESAPESEQPTARERLETLIPQILNQF